MRSDVPDEIKQHWKNVTNVRIIDYKVTQEELNKEFMQADIFVSLAIRRRLWLCLKQ